MPEQALAACRTVVRELAPHETGDGEAPVTIAREPMSGQDGVGHGGIRHDVGAPAA